MLRRTFLVSSTALGLTACATPSESSRSAVVPVDFAIYVVDDESTFRDTGTPYLRALKEAGIFESDDAVTPLVLPDYGREQGAMIRAPVVAIADDRNRLTSFFDNLPTAWRVPATHRIVVSQDAWADAPRTVMWGARAAWGDPIITNHHVIAVEASDDEVLVRLNPEGTHVFDGSSTSNVGRRLAIVVDGVTVADPVINERIPGGLIRITLRDGPQAHRELAERFGAT